MIDQSDTLARWRVAHHACVSHLTHCRECGVELCDVGLTLWTAADEAEARLPWMVAS